jgi:putative ABC transport system permease protein
MMIEKPDLDRLRRRLANHARRTSVEREMDEEMAFHLEMEIEDRIARGMTLEEARRTARRDFGQPAYHKEDARVARGLGVVRFGRDLRFAMRALRRSPGFSLVTIATLSVGIGAVVAIFAVLNAVILEPLPYPDPDRLVALSHEQAWSAPEPTGLSTGTYFHYRDHARSFEEIAIYSEAVVNVSGGDGETERLELAMAGPELFDVLQIAPHIGRLYTEEDGSRGFMDVTWPIPVLISHELWLRRYGGDAEIVGKLITINDRGREVVGVMPPDFGFPRPTTRIWMLSIPSRATATFNDFGYLAIGRLATRASAADAEVELAGLLPSMAGAYRGATTNAISEARLRPRVQPLREAQLAETASALWILFGAMGFLLLAVCANVANLFILRSESRARELSIRSALGARRGDLVRLFLAESSIVTGAGAGLGLLLAGLAITLVQASPPLEIPRLDNARIDLPVVLFAGLVTVVAALAFTGLSLLRRRPGASVTELRRAGSQGSAEISGRRARQLFVVTQVALAIVLLVGSALMLQSFRRLARTDPGFDPRGVLTIQVGIPGSRQAEHEAIYGSALERIRTLPGVESASAVTELPLADRVWTSPLAAPIRVPGDPIRSGDVERETSVLFFMPGYFDAIRTPVLEGSGISSAATEDATHPVVVNSALARRLFPSAQAVGRQIRRLQAPDIEILNQPNFTIVGVVADVRQGSLRAAPPEILYIPVLDPRIDRGWAPTELTFVIRSDLPVEVIAPAVRAAIGDASPYLGIAQVRTLESIVDASTARERFLAFLLVIAGAASLFLGALGIYGIVGYTVRCRTQEIGIRIALGARAAAVIKVVMKEASFAVATGCAIGLAAAVVSSRALGSFLYEVRPTDPVLLSIVTLTLAVTATIAGYLPARRATRGDPMISLRGD